MFKKKKQVVVVGNGMVGLRFCEKLLEYDAFHQHAMTVLGEEPRPAYDRVALSTLFDGRDEEELVLAGARWYRRHKINLRLNTRVVSIQRAEQTVETAAGEVFAYDHLVIATGSRPVVPDLPGTRLAGVHVYRTMDDARAIRAAARGASHAVVVGGGLLGLEAAEACREMGLNTSILERASFLMERQLDATAGRWLDRKIAALGIDMRLDARVEALRGDGAVEAVRLTRGESLPADLVVLAAGVAPNDDLGRAAGLELGARGGIAIAATTQTSDLAIHAIGECASFNDARFGLVAPGYAMAEVAAARLGHIHKTFAPAAPAAKLKLLDLQVASLGEVHLEAPEARCVVDQDPRRGVYKKLVLSNDLKRLLGAVLIGETSEFERLRGLLERGAELRGDPKQLLAPIGGPFAADLDLEDDDLVCFCNHVTLADIKRAIDEQGLKTTGEVMGATYAAGLCGSCLDVVDRVTKALVAERD